MQNLNCSLPPNALPTILENIQLLLAVPVFLLSSDSTGVVIYKPPHLEN